MNATANTTNTTAEELNNTRRTNLLSELAEAELNVANAQAQYDRLRAENDAISGQGTGAASMLRKGSAMRTAKRVVGWTLGAGVVALGGLYVVGRLRAAGVEVPLDGAADAVVEAVGTAVAG